MSQGNKPVFSTQSLARSGLIAALYAILVFLLPSVSFLAQQVRVAEALNVLAYFDPAAITGVYVGAVIANISSPFGFIDIIFGSLLTLVAASLTYAIGRYFNKTTSRNFYLYIGPIIALTPIVIINALGVAYIIKVASATPVIFIPTAISVGIGQLIAVYFLGYPFLQAIMKTPIYNKQKI